MTVGTGFQKMSYLYNFNFQSYFTSQSSSSSQSPCCSLHGLSGVQHSACPTILSGTFGSHGQVPASQDLTQVMVAFSQGSPSSPPSKWTIYPMGWQLSLKTTPNPIPSPIPTPSYRENESLVKIKSLQVSNGRVGYANIEVPTNHILPHSNQSQPNRHKMSG